jgi:hypothetical protein
MTKKSGHLQRAPDHDRDNQVDIVRATSTPSLNTHSFTHTDAADYYRTMADAGNHNTRPSLCFADMYGRLRM